MTFESIDEAKVYLKKNWKTGVKCPCCNQLVKRYRRKLYKSVAVCLVIFYRKYKHGEYHHKTELVKNSYSSTFGSGSFAMLAWWGLIKEKPKHTSKDSRTSGWWKITEKGKMFVEGKIKVKSHALVYNGNLLGLDGDMVDITDCIGEDFSYNELMEH
jgi:hypothetical protein